MAALVGGVMVGASDPSKGVAHGGRPDGALNPGDELPGVNGGSGGAPAPSAGNEGIWERTKRGVRRFFGGGSAEAGDRSGGVAANPSAYKDVLDHIARSEGTAHRPGGGYNTSLDYGRWLPGGTETTLTNKTLDEIAQLQEGMLANPENRAKYGSGNLRGSSAIGRYQIVSKTLRNLRDRLGLKGSDLFDEKMQDRLGAELARGRGADPAGLQQEWASLTGAKNAIAVELMRKVDPKASTVPLDRPAGQSSSRPDGAADPTDGKGVNGDLMRVVKRAQELSDVKFHVYEGLRTLERQKEMVARGWSKTMNSKHLTGRAVDLRADGDPDVGSLDVEKYKKINEAVQKASKELNVPIQWGGDSFGKFVDAPHFQLPDGFRSDAAPYPGDPAKAAKGGGGGPEMSPVNRAAAAVEGAAAKMRDATRGLEPTDAARRLGAATQGFNASDYFKAPPLGTSSTSNDNSTTKHQSYNAGTTTVTINTTADARETHDLWRRHEDRQKADNLRHAANLFA